MTNPTDTDKMRERLRDFEKPCNGECDDEEAGAWCELNILAFADSERALEREEWLARAREGAAPSLKAAENWLAGMARSYRNSLNHIVDMPDEMPLAIATELDRLRAKVAAQAAELEELRALCAEGAASIRHSVFCELDSLENKQALTVAERLEAVAKSKPQPQSADRATRFSYTCAENAEDARDGNEEQVLHRSFEEAEESLELDEHVYKVTITAERAEESGER